MKKLSNLLIVTTSIITIFLILAINCQTSPKAPKNIILMIADGWGICQIKVTDFYEYGKTDSVQEYEKFPFRCFMSTYSATGERYDPDKAWKSFDYLKRRPTDSAASATAFSTGVKTYGGAISVGTDSTALETIVEVAEKLGKSTGVVTSVPISHATPAGMAAHNKRRNNYIEIAQEMIYKSGLEVIMGCGNPMYDADGIRQPEDKYKYNYIGEDTWDALTSGSAGSDCDGDGVADNWTLIQDKNEFEALTGGDTPKRVIGVARIAGTLQKDRSGNTAKNDVTSAPYTDPLLTTVPALETMAAGALNVLDNNKNGFFLMIEGGAVDWAGHANTTPRMIEEMIDFNNAVEAVVKWVNENSSWQETLVIVTGDHETGYLTGPGSGTVNGAPVWTFPENEGKGNLPKTQWNSTGHTNQLIPLFANGFGSELFKEYADEIDSACGNYTDNAEVGQLMKRLFRMN